MKLNRTSVLAWLVCGAMVVATLINLARALLTTQAQGNFLQIAGLIIASLLPIASGGVGALILSNQPRNVIGWLLMLPPLAVLFEPLIRFQVESVTVPPVSPSLPLLISAYLINALWVVLVFPLFFIALLFPTGSPPSPRWRWIVGWAVGMPIFFLGVAAFAREFGPDPGISGVRWTVRNPIGFLSLEMLQTILIPWGVALGVLTLVSVASLFVRYRRATVVERLQIKWLLFACALFALGYTPGLFVQGDLRGLAADLFNVFFPLAILAFPLAIGIAILRFRLFDIDVILRRTVTYALVTALLVIVFFGSVILLQQVFSALTRSGQNEIVTVLSTLAIAALFIPVRNRVQNVIDRRFNRNRYNAQQVLTDFANTVRDETDLEKLTGRLMQVVDETMQPKSVSLWLKRTQDSGGRRGK